MWWTNYPNTKNILTVELNNKAACVSSEFTRIEVRGGGEGREIGKGDARKRNITNIAQEYSGDEKIHFCR